MTTAHHGSLEREESGGGSARRGGEVVVRGQGARLFGLAIPRGLVNNASRGARDTYAPFGPGYEVTAGLTLCSGFYGDILLLLPSQRSRP
jgi:hypothetical protein